MPRVVDPVQRRRELADAVLRVMRRDGLEHARLAALPPEPDPRRRAERALVELLPLDVERRSENEVWLAFTARAAVDPTRDTTRCWPAAELRSSSSAAAMKSSRRSAGTIEVDSDVIHAHKETAARWRLPGRAVPGGIRYLGLAGPGTGQRRDGILDRVDAPSEQPSTRRAELGQFLKARRARVSPDEAAVTPFGGGLRRVPGLRREELAQLAGVSADYYVRLEQGRGGNASRAVLDAIATALNLDDSERAYIHELTAPAMRRRRPSAPQRVSTAARALLDTLTDVPAYLTGPRTEILAWNPLAAALFVEFGALPPPQRNWARLVFLDPAMRELFADWTSKARETVAYLRFSAGRHRDDPQLAALVGELSLHSPEFRKLWSEHRVRDKTAGIKTLHHPIVGHLELSYSTWRASDNPDQVLIAYTPANTQAQSTLHLLATWTAPSNNDTTQRNAAGSGLSTERCFRPDTPGR